MVLRKGKCTDNKYAEEKRKRSEDKLCYVDAVWARGQRWEAKETSLTMKFQTGTQNSRRQTAEGLGKRVPYRGLSQCKGLKRE
jgi:hypothetical protein